MLYHATYRSGRDPFTGETTFETRILPTLRAVELWAESKLKGESVVTTNGCYWRDRGRAPVVAYRTVVKDRTTNQYEVSLGRRPYSQWRTGEVLPPIHIVASVGELGWTP
jgi:hypothetical protein